MLGGREGTAGSRAERPRGTVAPARCPGGPHSPASRCPGHGVPVPVSSRWPHITASQCPCHSVPIPVSRCPHIPALHTPLSPVPASALLPLGARQRCSRRWEQCGAASCWHGSMRCLRSVSPQEAPIRGAGHPPSRTKPQCPTSPGVSVKFQQLHQHQPKPRPRPRGCFSRQGSEAWVRAPHNLPDPTAELLLSPASGKSTARWLWAGCVGAASSASPSAVAGLRQVPVFNLFSHFCYLSCTHRVDLQIQLIFRQPPITPLWFCPW